LREFLFIKGVFVEWYHPTDLQQESRTSQSEESRMKNGQCPKCNSSNVFKYAIGVRFGDHGGGSSLTIFSGDLNHLSHSDYDSYVCVDCGYCENYILDNAILQEVQKKWAKVT